jgi:hypothetical protein
VIYTWNLLIQLKKIDNMKTPKLWVLFTFLLATCFQAYPQIFRIHAGLNMSEMSVSTDQDIKYFNRIHIGMTAEFTAGHYLSFEAGLFRSPKGFKTVTFEETSMGTRKDKYLFGPNYADVFFNAKFTYDLDNFRVFGFAGPFIAIGTGGKEKTIVYYDGDKAEVTSRPLSWGSGPENDIRRFDFGFSFGAGAEYRAFQLRLFYQLGMPDVSPSTESWEDLKNRVIGISAGFRFLGS